MYKVLQSRQIFKNQSASKVIFWDFSEIEIIDIYITFLDEHSWNVYSQPC